MPASSRSPEAASRSRRRPPARRRPATTSSTRGALTAACPPASSRRWRRRRTATLGRHAERAAALRRRALRHLRSRQHAGAAPTRASSTSSSTPRARSGPTPTTARSPRCATASSVTSGPGRARSTSRRSSRRRRDGSPVFVLDRGAVIRRAGGRHGRAWDVQRPPGGALPLFAEDGGRRPVAPERRRPAVAPARPAPSRRCRARPGRHATSMPGARPRRAHLGRHRRRDRRLPGDRFEVDDAAERRGPPRRLGDALHARRQRLWVIANGRARQARRPHLGVGGRHRARPDRPLGEARSRIARAALWCSHFGKGVLHVRADGRSRWITDADGLPGNRVRDLVEDREGNVWLAIERGGPGAAARRLVRDAAGRGRARRRRSRRSPKAATARSGSGRSAAACSAARTASRRASRCRRRRPAASSSRSSPTPTGRVWLSADQEDLFYVDGDRDPPRPGAACTASRRCSPILGGGLWIGTKTGLSRLERRSAAASSVPRTGSSGATCARSRAGPTAPSGSAPATAPSIAIATATRA